MSLMRLTAVLLLAACGGRNAGDDCACDEGLVCVHGECLSPCQHDSDCDDCEECDTGACVPASDCCEPATCDDLDFDCGEPDDGCGGVLSCGTCEDPQTCGGGGDDFVCGCTPAVSCDTEDQTCGTLTDDCGETQTCGAACPLPVVSDIVITTLSGALSDENVRQGMGAIEIEVHGSSLDHVTATLQGLTLTSQSSDASTAILQTSVPHGATLGNHQLTLTRYNAATQINDAVVVTPITVHPYRTGDAGNDADDGATTRPLRTVTHALTLLGDGDTMAVLSLDSGLEDFPWTITHDDVTLVGDPDMIPFVRDIDFADEWNTAFFLDGDITLRNFDVSYGETGIYVMGGTVVLDNVILSGNNAEGLLTSGTADVTLTNCHAFNNGIYDDVNFTCLYPEEANLRVTGSSVVHVRDSILANGGCHQQFGAANCDGGAGIIVKEFASLDLGTSAQPGNNGVRLLWNEQTGSSTGWCPAILDMRTGNGTITVSETTFVLRSPQGVAPFGIVDTVDCPYAADSFDNESYSVQSAYGNSATVWYADKPITRSAATVCLDPDDIW